MIDVELFACFIFISHHSSEELFLFFSPFSPGNRYIGFHFDMPDSDGSLRMFLTAVLFGVIPFIAWLFVLTLCATAVFFPLFCVISRRRRIDKVDELSSTQMDIPVELHQSVELFEHEITALQRRR